MGRMCDDPIVDEDAINLRRNSACGNIVACRQNACPRHRTRLGKFNFIACGKLNLAANLALIRHHVAGRLDLPARGHQHTHLVRGTEKLQEDARKGNCLCQFAQTASWAGEDIAPGFIRQGSFDAQSTVIRYRRRKAARHRTGDQPPLDQQGIDARQRVDVSHARRITARRDVVASFFAENRYSARLREDRHFRHDALIRLSPSIAAKGSGTPAAGGRRRGFYRAGARCRHRNHSQRR